MKRISIVVLSLSLLTVSHRVSDAQHAKAVQAIVRILTGVGAAESIRRSGQSYQEYKHEDAILTSLRSQGIDANNSSIYSVYFETSGGLWADFWSKPDLFFIVDIEGQGSKLVPQVHYNYQGEPVLDVVVSDSIRPGSRVIVRVLDDDSVSDSIWNGILTTRANVSVSPEIRVTKFVSVRASASGEITLLDQHSTLDPPDFIASAHFLVPETEDGLWVAEADLLDDARQNVGSLKFASLWSAPQILKEQQQKTATSFGKSLFWGVIAVCLAGWFLWSLATGSNSTEAKPDKA